MIDQQIKNKEKLTAIALQNVSTLKSSIEANNVSKSEQIKLRQRALALDELHQSVPFEPSEEDEIGLSRAIVNTANQIRSLESFLNDSNHAKKHTSDDIQLQEVVQHQLKQMSRQLDKSIEAESKKIAKPESSDPEKTAIDSLQAQIDQQIARERNIMSRLKQVLAIISEEMEQAQELTTGTETAQLNLQIVQNLLNGLMTDTPSESLATGLGLHVHPLIRQLIKANIVTVSEDMTLIKLKPYGMDFEDV